MEHETYQNHLQQFWDCNSLYLYAFLKFTEPRHTHVNVCSSIMLRWGSHLMCVSSGYNALQYGLLWHNWWIPSSQLLWYSPSPNQSLWRWRQYATPKHQNKPLIHGAKTTKQPSTEEQPSWKPTMGQKGLDSVILVSHSALSTPCTWKHGTGDWHLIV